MIKLRNQNYKNEFIDTCSGLINVSHIVRCFYDMYKQTYMIETDQNYGEMGNIASYTISKQNYDKIYKLFHV